jgi:Transposase DDE domain
MATKAKSKASKAKTKQYRVKNWKEYNESLVNRGSLTLWLSDEVLASWEHAGSPGKVGRPFTYSDRAMETLLTLRELFQLTYRQTEGLGKSLMTLMRLKLGTPDYTSLQKRAVKLTIDLNIRQRKGPLNMVVDSTGLKVYGEGEWKVRQHGIGKRRTWRKLHVAVNPDTHEIVAELLTTNASHDADQAAPLVRQTKGRVSKFWGDGAYDKWKVYEELAARGIETVIPPQRNAKIKQHGNASTEPLPRDEAIRAIRRQGRAAWKREVGYHRRSLGETGMYRLKTTFGNKLKNRKLETQHIEARIRCRVLNRFTQLGMPKFEWN